MANEIEKYNIIALGSIEKINGLTDGNIQEINGFEFTYVPPVSYKGILGFGTYAGGGSGDTGKTNLVSTSGVIAADTTAVGGGRRGLAACEFGTGEAIFAYGTIWNQGHGYGISNKVNTSGVVASDVSGIAVFRVNLAACGYGGDKGAFAYGNSPVNYDGWYDDLVNEKNLVSNSGVIGASVAGVGTDRDWTAATQYGGDKGIFGFGHIAGSPYYLGITNLLSNSGVIGSDVTAVGAIRNNISACSYGTGHTKGIFMPGQPDSSGGQVTNLVSDSGVIASDVSLVGTFRLNGGACEIGTDIAIDAFGAISGTAYVATSQLISNLGVVSADVSAVAGVLARNSSAGCTFGT